MLGEQYQADKSVPYQAFKGATGRRTPGGALILPEADYIHCEKIDIVDYELGDCLVMTPYTVHASIPNRGEGMRWTIVLKVDDALKANHAVESLHPFPMTKYLPPYPAEKKAAADGG